jgi:hypothetical protein
VRRHPWSRALFAPRLPDHLRHDFNNARTLLVYALARIAEEVDALAEAPSMTKPAAGPARRPMDDELTRLDASQAARLSFLTGGAFTPRARAFLAEVPNPRLEKPFDPQGLRTFVRSLV